MSAANKGYHWERKAWSRVYRNRMDQGLERCRLCRGNADLTFDHVRPWSLKGPSGMHNVTILCSLCNTRKGDRIVRGLQSLADEEASAPPEHRWSQLAQEWDPLWTPPKCPAAVYVVNVRAEPLLRCALQAGHDWWHWDDEIGLWGDDAAAVEGGSNALERAERAG